ncbi:MAG: hypothetical protein JWN18_256 [Parcubacteria group bacterium]|nr:hypothetical protein [Parcubacteria group bacterium]
MRWEPTTHRFLRPTVVDFAAVPEIAREQTQNLLCRLGDDARWVAQPIAHSIEHTKFDGNRFDLLVAMNFESPHNFSRTGWVHGLEELAEKYPLVPSILWDTIATMGLRPNADQEEAIPNLGGILRHPWSLSDAALHGAAKTTALWLDICSTLQRRSGRYPEHDCGCSHIFRELRGGAQLPQASEDRVPHLQKAWWEHFLSELALIHVFGFPFALHQSLKTYEGTLIPA